MTSPSPSSPRPGTSHSSSQASTPSPSASSSSPRPTPAPGSLNFLMKLFKTFNKPETLLFMTSSGSKRIVEGDYVQTLPEASNDWHYVKITAQPGSDKVLSFLDALASLDFKLSVVN